MPRHRMWYIQKLEKENRLLDKALGNVIMELSEVKRLHSKLQTEFQGIFLYNQHLIKELKKKNERRIITYTYRSEEL